jgi:phospholipid/cholesterol/gamma-HCH transport system ATP-binding protein
MTHEPMIRVEKVRKLYFGETVLDDVSLQVGRGQHLGLLGPGGAGKSLLVKIIVGLVKPDAGRVWVGGVEVTALKERELQEFQFTVGMLFQNYALFDFMNVEDNIAFPLRQIGKLPEDEVKARVQAQLKAVSLPTIGHQYPRELSGGMKKRVSFARAVITDPPILFYDDPTAGLDPVISAKIFLLLAARQAAGGTTAVTISHDVGGLRGICDRFALLDRGRLVFDDTREAFERSDIPLVRHFREGSSDD